MVETVERELPIIQMTYDLMLWYVPILNRLPRDHKFTPGRDRPAPLCCRVAAVEFRQVFQCLQDVRPARSSRQRRLNED